MTRILKALKMSFYLVAIVLGCMYILNYLFHQGEAALYVINNTDTTIEEVQIKLHNQSHTIHTFGPGQQKKIDFSVWREGGYSVAIKFLNRPTVKYKVGYLIADFDTSEELRIFKDKVELTHLNH